MPKARDEATSSANSVGNGRYSMRLVGKPQCLDASGAVWLDLQPKAAALLAMLAVDGALPRATLAARLWPEAGDDKPRANLRGLLRDLRKLCGRELVTGGDTLELATGVTHDLQALAGALSSLDEAAAGELLGAHDYTELDAFSEWLERARDRWRVSRQAAVAALATHLESSGRSAAALQAAQRLVSDDPLDEAAWRLLMGLLAARGERVAALSAYARCQAAVRQGLGAEVASATRALATSIELGQASAPRVESASVRPALAPMHMVGRKAELAAIAAAWADGRHVLLEGEPGIGKSRILHALIDEHPGTLVQSATRIDDAEVPFSTLMRALHGLLAYARPALDAATAAELARLLPQFGAAATSPARTQVLAQALAGALRAWRAQGLLGLLIDDLQWADAASLSLLLPALALKPGPCCVLALRAGQRPAALVQAVAAAPADWSEVAAPPFDAAELQALLLAMPIDMEAPLAWAQTLSPRAMGNPLHLIETVAALRHTLGERAFRQAPPPAGHLPEPVALAQLVQARLGRLSERQRHLAQLVALAGDLFSVPLAREVMGLNELELGSLWTLLESLQVLKGAALAHDTLREPLLAMLPQPVARELHARVARHGHQHGGAAAEVARHWWRAQDWPAAALAFESAAAQARAVNARVDELRLWDQAVGAHERSGQTAAAHAARCQACAAALTVEQAHDALARAEALSALAVTELQRLDACLAHTDLAFLNHDLPRLQQAGEAAWGLARQLQSQGVLAAEDERLLRAGCAWSHSLTFSGQTEAALKELDGLADAAARCRSLHWRLKYHAARGTAYALAGRGHAAVIELSKSLELARAAEDMAEVQQQLLNLGVNHGRLGNYRRALELVRESVALGVRLGEVRGLVSIVVGMTVAGYCGRMGRYGEALSGMEAALAAFRASEAGSWVGDCESHLALLLLDLGCPDRARAALQTPPAGGDHALVRGIVELRLARAAGQDVQAAGAALLAADATTRPENRLTLSLLLARDEEPAQAVGTCQRALDESLAPGSLALAQHARVLLCDALHRAGRHDEAAEIATQVLGGIDECQPHSMYLPEALWFAARALRAAGQPQSAVQVLQRARNWVVDEALPHVPPELRRNFLEDNPINRQLLAATSA